MHVRELLSRWLTDGNMIGHARRADSLAKTVEALVHGGKACLTSLGRSRRGSAQVKHQIKAVDRLLGNEHLHGEVLGVYRALARSVLGRVRRPVVLVDWSDFECSKGRKWAMLKAGVATSGRCFVLFSRVFPFERYNSPEAHCEFLLGLSRVLPPRCKPIIVTDAGFRGPWFRDVEKLGWDWVGRIRNKIRYFNESTGRWAFTDSLYKRATPTMKYLGKVRLSRRKKYLFNLYLMRAHAPRKRGPRKPAHNSPNVSLYRRLHKAPWLLATSLPHDRLACRSVQRLYSARMQIEESIRDTKSHRFGFGLEYAKSNSPARMEVLLLLVALAALALWLVGLAGKSEKLHHQLQANTLRTRSVLSTPFLGRLLIARDMVRLSEHLIRSFLPRLRQSLMTLETG